MTDRDEIERQLNPDPHDVPGYHSATGVDDPVPDEEYGDQPEEMHPDVPEGGPADDFDPGDWVRDSTLSGDHVARVAEIVNDHVVSIDYFDGRGPEEINARLVDPTDPLDHPIDVGSVWKDITLGVPFEVLGVTVDESGETQVRLEYRELPSQPETVDAETFIGRVAGGAIEHVKSGVTTRD